MDIELLYTDIEATRKKMAPDHRLRHYVELAQKHRVNLSGFETSASPSERMGAISYFINHVSEEEARPWSRFFSGKIDGNQVLFLSSRKIDPYVLFSNPSDPFIAFGVRGSIPDSEPDQVYRVSVLGKRKSLVPLLVLDLNQENYSSHYNRVGERLKTNIYWGKSPAKQSLEELVINELCTFLTDEERDPKILSKKLDGIQKALLNKRKTILSQMQNNVFDLMPKMKRIFLERDITEFERKLNTRKYNEDQIEALLLIYRLIETGFSISRITELLRAAHSFSEFKIITENLFNAHMHN